MKYFGTDGIRGIYKDELSEQLAYNAGLAASSLFDVCFVATDTRPSGEALSQALISGLRGGGCAVRRLGILPTPAVAFLSGKYGTGGIAITASHNPPSYNGLKFFYKGYKLSTGCESMLEDEIDCPPAHIGGGAKSDYDGRSEYIEHLLTMASDLGGRHIAVDCAHGATFSVAQEVFERCGARVTAICCDDKGEQINCGVGALYPQHALGAAPLCFSFDGDGDRLAVCDSSVVDGDSVLYNLALMLSPSGVVGTVMNNMALEQALGKMNVPFIRTAVGDRYIGDAMRIHGYELGGEQSGHYIISPATSGDALLSALMVAKMDEIKRLDLIPCVEASIASSKQVFSDERFTSVVCECKKSLSKGRLVVRMSGTEPKIRLMAQGEEESKLSLAIGMLSETIISLNKEYGL